MSSNMMVGNVQVFPSAVSTITNPRNDMASVAGPTNMSECMDAAKLGLSDLVA